MSGHIYAFDSLADAGQELPHLFGVDDADEPVVTGGAMLYSSRGVWLVAPVMSEPDEDGNQTITTPGTRSALVVILSPNDEELPGFEINPPGVQGFA
jgi:hypothetical protein